MTAHRWIVVVSLAAAAVILVLQVLVPPVVGLANNGDFEKVMAPVGLDFLSTDYGEQNWRWALTRFAFVAPHPSRSGALYSEILLAKVAVKVSRVLMPGSPQIWDIRWLGALHALLLMAAFALILSGCRELAIRTQIAVAVLLVFFFTDVGYVSLFNSLYGQTTSFLFVALLAGTVTLAVRRGRLGGWLLIVYFVSAVLFVSSKPQECIHGPLLAILALPLAGIGLRNFWRRPATYLAIGLIWFSGWYYYAIPGFEIREVARYHTVFMELLPHSPDPAADLAELGLDADMIRYSGIHAYLPTSPLGLPQFKERFFKNFGYRKLLVFYAKHPLRLHDLLTRAGRRAFRLRPPGLGNYDQASGKARFEVSRRFALWSDGRALLGWGGLLVIAALFGGILYASVREYGRASPRARLFRIAVTVLVIMATLEFLVCSLADYLGDVSRHLFTFHAMFDLIFLTAIAWIVEASGRRRVRTEAPVETERPARGKKPAKARRPANAKRVA